MSTTGEYRLIPLAEIRESPHNPRKTFNPEKLAELTASIKAKGVVTPVLVRPATGGGYELAAGHRRRRASELAGLTELPAIVKEMGDEEFLELLTIENVQREDVEPLEEADGYRVLIDTWRFSRAAGGEADIRREDVERLAQKIGKSVSYVYQRLKLLELIEEARAALEAGVITPGHAILLARLQPADQAVALGDCVYREGGSPNKQCHRTVRQLGDFIRSFIHCDLSAAPFKKDDPALVPEAGACSNCPKRARNNQDLYQDADPKKDQCMDRTCFQAKLRALVERHCAEETLLRVSDVHYDSPRKGVFGWRQVRVLEGKGADCGHSQKAIYVDGSKMGHVVKICVDRKCKFHGGGGSTSASLSAEEKKRRERARTEATRREEVLRQMLARVSEPALPRAAMELAALAFWNEIWHDVRKKLGAVWSLQSIERDQVAKDLRDFSDERLSQFLVSLAVARDLLVGPYEDGGKPAALNAMAKIFGLDAAKVKAPPAAKPLQKTRPAKEGAVQTSAKEGKKR